MRREELSNRFPDVTDTSGQETTAASREVGRRLHDTRRDASGNPKIKLQEDRLPLPRTNIPRSSVLEPDSFARFVPFGTAFPNGTLPGTLMGQETYALDD